MSQLAIVIPAYKDAFFDKALRSLANQTKKDFTIYIGDDNSPFDLKSVIKKYENKLDIKYTRFENNIGAKNLVHQWKRCVELTNGENWLWLFSDDDIADNTCVERFFEQVESDQGRLDVYRFNTVVIDKDDKVVHISPSGPDYEVSEEMAYNLLMGQRGNSMPDHIFSKEVYEKRGGFVYTSYAQAADWATSILFSKDKGIKIITGAKLYWRYSGSNISSLAPKKKKEMLEGHLEFIEWTLNHFIYLNQTSSTISYSMIKEAALKNLLTVITNHYKGFSVFQTFRLIKFIRQNFHLSLRKTIHSLFMVKESNSPVLKRIVYVLKGVKRKVYA